MVHHSMNRVGDVGCVSAQAHALLLRTLIPVRTLQNIILCTKLHSSTCEQIYDSAQQLHQYPYQILKIVTLELARVTPSIRPLCPVQKTQKSGVAARAYWRMHVSAHVPDGVLAR